ncbi:hypothetical protein [Pseudactinotalea sp.]|uniref:hypothetical protein n=1 Tax=Pseudactinotalea sp. TaxID=1926260 RepID=UPI003B3BAB98
MKRRWVVAGMAVIALAAGAGANAIDNHHLATGWHTVVRGDEGVDVVAANYQVHVHGATASPHVEDREPVTSPGIFVLVDLSYATTDAWGTPEEVMLMDADGREFTSPGGFSSAGRPWLAGPDIWYRGGLLFEVPADAVDDLTLVFNPERPHTLLPGTTARIPLTVTPSSTPLMVEDRTVLAEGDR